jgi:sugar lactone lactonase YvrE
MGGITGVKYHVLRDTKEERVVTDEIRVDRRRDMDLYENRVALTSLLMHPADGRLYCGVTAFNHDIFHRFDVEARKFESLGYADVAEEFEVKVHRSLCLASDGALYGASACLYGLEDRLKAPGGAIFRYHPDEGRIEKLAVPVKHDYIQTITLDEARGLIYGLTYPVFKFFVYHIDTGEVEDYDYVGSITHISALDDNGCFWGTWDWRRHFLFKYNPDTREITYFHHGTPNAEKEAGIMYPGAGPVDVMINGGDGFLYIGTTGGSLCRLNPKTAEVEYLGHPAPTRRLPGLVVWKDGLLLGAGGDMEGGFVFTYDRESGAFRRLGGITAPDGKKLYRVHDLCLSLDGRTAYVAETDVPRRSGYLWECELG